MSWERGAWRAQNDWGHMPEPHHRSRSRDMSAKHWETHTTTTESRRGPPAISGSSNGKGCAAQCHGAFNNDAPRPSSNAWSWHKQSAQNQALNEEKTIAKQTTTELNAKSEQLEEALRKLQHVRQEFHSCHNELQDKCHLNDELTAKYARVEQLAEHTTRNTTELEVQRRQLEQTRSELCAVQQQAQTIKSQMHASNRKNFEEKHKLNKELTEAQERVEKLSEFNNDKSNEVQMQLKQLEETQSALETTRQHCYTLEGQSQAEVRVVQNENEALKAEVNLFQGAQREQVNMCNLVNQLGDLAAELYVHHIGPLPPDSFLAELRSGRNIQGARPDTFVDSSDRVSSAFGVGDSVMHGRQTGPGGSVARPFPGAMTNVHPSRLSPRTPGPPVSALAPLPAPGILGAASFAVSRSASAGSTCPLTR